MFRLFFILFTGLVLFASCRSTKKIQTAIAPKDTTVVVMTPKQNGYEDSLLFIRESYEKLMKNHISFETFSAKINVDYQGSDGKKYDVNAFVRMRKDSVIWISINGALGIEGMRLMINTDSVFILNKLDKEYQAKSLSYLQDVASLPLDLQSLQDLIIGNPVFLDSNLISYSVAPNTISLLNKGDWFRHLITISDNDHLVLDSKLDDADELRNRTCYLNYSSYEDKKGVEFSTNRIISVTAKTKLDVKMNFKQYDFNEMLTFPFSVPKNYKRL